jgi:hypothetical protein
LAEVNPEYASAIKEMSFVHNRVSIEEIDDENNYAYIRWNVPYLATIKSGALTIAISVSDTYDTNYLWQTVPAILTVQPNIGLRSAGGAIDIQPVSPKDIKSINDRLKAIECIFSADVIAESPTVTLVKEGSI